MKHLLFLAGLVFAATITTALADEGTNPKIKKGDVEANGSMTFSRDIKGGSSTLYFDTTLTGQYFLKDCFSAGLEGQFAKYGSYLAASAAPIFTKYFWVKDDTAPYLSMLPIAFHFQSHTPTHYSTTLRPGVKFFLNDHIAIGPAVDYKHFWSHDGYESRDQLSLLGTLSVHF